MREFFYDKITCPFCHGRGLPDGVFSHKDVHFRMETFFEDEADLNDEGLSLEDIRRMPEGPAKARLMEQVRENEPFLCRNDDVYEKFWEEYDGTTEVAYGTDKKNLTFHPNLLPILNPSDPEHQRYLKAQRKAGGDARDDFFLYDGSGMVMGVVDIHGKETFRRVCPNCHNPLPVGYGKYETKFISIIGVTSSGKTVFISQLLKHIKRYANFVDLTANFTSDHEPGFVSANPVRYGEPLPRPTGRRSFAQPLFYDLVQDVGRDRNKTDTIVLYDIAGENCADPQGMMKFGRFVTKSDGIIVLLDPMQLDLARTAVAENEEEIPELEVVFNTIYNAFQEKKADGKLTVPMAVCISKSDLIADILPEECRGRDIVPVRDPNSGEPVKKFNAREYNVLEDCLATQMRNGTGQAVHGALRRQYKHFNYFAFSATGCGVEKGRDDLSYPVDTPEPLRIAEPLLWLFYKFGYIRSDVPIRIPVQRDIPNGREVKPTGPFAFLKKPTMRPLTEEEKERYWYEP